MKQKQKNLFGFSNIRLWPFYGFFSGSILLLFPITGSIAAVLIVGIPSLIGLYLCAKHDKTEWVTIQQEIGLYVESRNKPNKSEVNNSNTESTPNKTPLVNFQVSPLKGQSTQPS